MLIYAICVPIYEFNNLNDELMISTIDASEPTTEYLTSRSFPTSSTTIVTTSTDTTPTTENLTSTTFSTTYITAVTTSTDTTSTTASDCNFLRS